MGDPTAVSRSSSSGFGISLTHDNPKSHTLTSKLDFTYLDENSKEEGSLIRVIRTRMLGGLMSRWMIGGSRQCNQFIPEELVQVNLIRIGRLKQTFRDILGKVQLLLNW